MERISLRALQQSSHVDTFCIMYQLPAIGTLLNTSREPATMLSAWHTLLHLIPQDARKESIIAPLKG